MKAAQEQKNFAKLCTYSLVVSEPKRPVRASCATQRWRDAHGKPALQMYIVVVSYLRSDAYTICMCIAAKLDASQNQTKQQEPRRDVQHSTSGCSVAKRPRGRVLGPLPLPLSLSTHTTRTGTPPRGRRLRTDKHRCPQHTHNRPLIPHSNRSQ